MEKILYTIEETAEMLSLSVQGIFRLMRVGAIKPVRISGRTLFRMEEIQRIATEGYKPQKKEKNQEEPEEPMDEEAVKLMKDFNL